MNCIVVKEKNNYVEEHIKKIQDTYKQEDVIMKKQDIKGKQWIQDEEVLLYKSYKVDSPKSKTSKLIFIQDKIKNLEKYMKFIQVSIQTTPFYLPPYYQSLWPQGEKDKQYWKEIVVIFLEKKHNADTTRKGLSIEMYTEGLPHKSYFIALTLWGQIIIGSTKKLVATYMVRDLALLDWFMWIWMLKQGYYYDYLLMSLACFHYVLEGLGYDAMIGCAIDCISQYPI